MSNHVRVPVREINGEKWAHLSAFAGHAQLICGEVFRQKEDIGLAGGHRVRVYTVKKNVHWKIPDGTALDISGVSPASDPPRRLPNR